ncbi:unnamed protein product [Lactuca saligna]|uniref:Uncharacterized protein n=1 Tax=Lactuca saligna TaxID=75948 RepID=A0AA35ZW11_LACSI|nr:unnamed protein product [Lactuca saligna]
MPSWFVVFYCSKLCCEFTCIWLQFRPCLIQIVRVVTVVTSDARTLKGGKVILESKLVENHCFKEQVMLLPGKLASLELENIGNVDNIAILDMGVRKLKGDLMVVVFQNTNLQASLAVLTKRVQKFEEDVMWVLSEEICKVVDKVFPDLSFYNANHTFKLICIHFVKRQGCEIMHHEHSFGLAEVGVAFYVYSLIEDGRSFFKFILWGFLFGVWLSR